MIGIALLGVLIAADVTSWPRIGVALLVCVVVLLTIAMLLVNLRRNPSPRPSEPDPLLLPHAHTSDHEPIDV